ncbi:MAG TPA: hypothetical protein VFI31_04890 [Pirellulales bacterium]|nr:hypothetical protein [Pirellulales bacterium]
MTAFETTPDHGPPVGSPCGDNTSEEAIVDATLAVSSDRGIMDDLGGSEPPPVYGGFSLASLFLLVTAAGVIALLARNIVETDLKKEIVILHAIVGGFIGAIVGAIVGASYPRFATGFFLGGFVGAVTGGVCAATAASGGSPWLFCVGAAALIGLGFAARWMHREAE